MTSFNYSHFWDIVVTKDSFSFCILHCHGGPVEVEVFFQSILIFANNSTITDVGAYPIDYSRSRPTYDFVAELDEVCFFNSSLLFFAYSPTLFSPIRVSTQDLLNFSVVMTKFKSFVQETQNFHDAIGIIIASRQTHPSLILFDVIIPLWGVINNHLEHLEHFYPILLFNQSELLPSIRILLPTEPFQQNVCLGHIKILRHIGAIPMVLNESTFNNSNFEDYARHLDWIFNLKPDILLPLKAVLFNGQIDPLKIVVDQQLPHVADLLQLVNPSLKVVIIPHNSDLNQLKTILGDANVFFACDFLSYSLSFLMQTGATLVEIIPVGFEFINLGKRFADLSQLKHIAIHDPVVGHCKCEQMDCYFNKKIRLPGIDQDLIFRVLHHIYP